MLNILSYTNCVLTIKEETNNEFGKLIDPLQDVTVNLYNEEMGYMYEHPDSDKIEIYINSINILKKSINNILEAIENVRKYSKQISISHNNLRLIFKNTNKSLVETIRKTLLSDIETLAFDNIEIIDNKTYLPDEVWKQRIELIPLKTNAVSIPFNADGYFLLEKEYKNNIDNYVTSNNLVSNNKKTHLVYNDIIIYKLNINQRIKIKAYYKKGSSNNHTKWCSVRFLPVCFIFEFFIKKEDVQNIIPYYISYNININEEKDGISIRTKEETCKNILENINNNNSFNDKILYSEYIQMDIISVGQYTSEHLFHKALDILERKYKNFLKALSDERLIQD